MKKKNKWYKDKWGWIGVGIYPILLFIILMLDDVNPQLADFLLKIVGFPFLILFRNYSSPVIGGGFVLLLLVFPFGFIFGLLIHKLFIKFKWVKK